MTVPSRLDIESQLYGIIQVLKSIHQRLKSGNISYTAYTNTIREKLKQLMVLELTLQAKELIMDEVLEKMNLSDDFFQLIPQIHKHVELIEQEIVQTYKSPTKLTDSEQILDNIAKKSHKMAVYGNHKIHPLQLANLSSEITAGFITIFDFLKMDIEDTHLLQETFQRLMGALKTFPGMDELFLDLSSFIRKIDSKMSTNKKETFESFEKYYRRFLTILKQPSNL